MNRFGLSGLGNQPGAKTSGTDLHPDGPPLPDRLDFVKVGVPYFSSLIIGVTHMMPEDGALSAQITYFRHRSTSLRI
jgi:hypothetical protein